jgi:hypothetical protein
MEPNNEQDHEVYKTGQEMNGVGKLLGIMEDVQELEVMFEHHVVSMCQTAS